MSDVARRRLEQLRAELSGAGPGPLPDPTPEPTSEKAPDPAPDSVVEPGAEPTVLPTPGRHARSPQRSVAAWVNDRMPPALRGRVALGTGHLAVVAVLVAVALAATTAWSLRSRGEVVDVGAAAVPAQEAPSPLVQVSAPPAPSASAVAGVLVVHVAGKVRRPGIATLPAGSRVIDALEAAGGARPGVDLTGLNLARLLVDGEQILVGVAPAPGVAAGAASAASPSGVSSPLVNLNTADQAELESLPGVGPVTAAAIIAWRTEQGGFTAVDELLEVSGIGEATLAQIAPFVTL